MLRSWFLISIVSVFVIGCTDQGMRSANLEKHSQTSIMGGEPALKNSSVTPSTVMIIVDMDDALLNVCTGVLISKDIVLTAAHCLSLIEDNKFYVAFGTEIPASVDHPLMLNPFSWKEHPSYEVIYNKNGEQIGAVNDLALIRLLDPIPEGAMPVVLQSDRTFLTPGSSVLLAGYGVTDDFDGGNPAEGLNYVRVPVAQQANTYLLTDQRNLKGACYGDSGGPAYYELNNEVLVLVGITRGSFDGESSCSQYGEYTSVSGQLEFIDSTSKSLGGQTPLKVSIY